MTKTPQELAAYLLQVNAWRRRDTGEPMPDPTELGKAIDQVIAILEDLPKRVLSDCCKKPVMFGKTGSTQWYGCPECCQPCDVYYLYNEPTQPQPQ
jgi:hypothetical protein